MSSKNKSPESGQCGPFSAVKRAWCRCQLGIVDQTIPEGTSPAGTQACIFGLLLERVDRRTLTIKSEWMPRLSEIAPGYYADKTVAIALRALEACGLIGVQRQGKNVVSIHITHEAVTRASVTATDPKASRHPSRLRIPSVTATDSIGSDDGYSAPENAAASVAATDGHPSSRRMGSVTATDPHHYRSPPLPHHDPHLNPQGGTGWSEVQPSKPDQKGPPTSRSPGSQPKAEPIASPPSPPPMPIPATTLPPEASFTLTPPEPPAPPKASRKTAAPKEPRPPKPTPTPRAKKPPEEQAHTRYLDAFDRGVAKGAGLPAFATTPHSLVKQDLITIAKAHARKDGECIVGEELLAWFEARAEAFRRHASEELKFKGGYCPKGFLWWLNQGCPGEPKPEPKRPRTPNPPSLLDQWKAQHGPIKMDHGKSLAELTEEVGRGFGPRPPPRVLTPEEELDDAKLRELHERKKREWEEAKARLLAQEKTA